VWIRLNSCNEDTQQRRVADHLPVRPFRKVSVCWLPPACRPSTAS
jgi:hypothetical protein